MSGKSFEERAVWPYEESRSSSKLYSMKTFNPPPDTTSPCRNRLERYFRDHWVSYQIHPHHQAFTTQQVAAVEHVSGKKFAKVVMVLAGGKALMLVLPASRRVSLERVARVMGESDIRLLREEEFADAFRDCEPGAMPPFGNLYGFPVLADKILLRQPIIYFQAGSHRETMSIRYVDFARLAHPLIGDFTYAA